MEGVWKSTRRLALTAALAAVALAAFASSLTAGGVGARVRQAVARYCPRGARVGVVVRDLKAKKRVYGRKADTLISLASNTKLFTTAAALCELGPKYQFKTTILASGPIRGGTLEGDLVLRGGGDPNISGRFHKGDCMAVPRAWAAAVRKAGVTRIKGDLLVDDRFFDRKWTAPGWPAGQRLAWYSAPVGALSFNDNCVKLTVTGGARSGQASSAKVRPFFNGLGIVNRCRTVGSGAGGWVGVQRKGALTFLVTGTIRARLTRARSAVTVGDPGLFLGHAFSYALRSGGVDLRGKVRRPAAGEPKAPLRTLHVLQSPLLQSIGIANKRSQNLYAEMILKTLGAEKLKVGSFGNGVRAIAAFHRRIGLPKGRVHLSDGSGLSRTNRARPSAVVYLLDYMNRSPHATAFRKSLSVGGVDGTLRHRFKTPSCRGRIFAKTGTLRDVSALSGYAEGRDGRRYAFSILCDGLRKGGLAGAKVLQIRVCQAIVSGP